MRPRGTVAVALVLLAAIAVGWLARTERHESPAPAGSRSESRGSATQAFAERRSNVWIEDEGTVETILRDDLEGSRHQRFIIRLTTGGTLLVVHNIDLSPRVPVAAGDHVTFRGEYVWNDEGGLVHWTHHDPQGRLRGGWIRHERREYR